MQTQLPSTYRHFYFDDLGPELPLLAIGSILMTVTIIAVYLYASTL